MHWETKNLGLRRSTYLKEKEDGQKAAIWHQKKKNQVQKG